MARRRYPEPANDYDANWAADLVRVLNQESVDNSQPKGTGYTIAAGFTPTRSLDASTATLQNTKDFLATLVQDLINAGVLKD